MNPILAKHMQGLTVHKRYDALFIDRHTSVFNDYAYAVRTGGQALPEVRIETDAPLTGDANIRKLCNKLAPSNPEVFVTWGPSGRVYHILPFPDRVEHTVAHAARWASFFGGTVTTINC